MRTQAEILVRISEVSEDDFFGFECEILKSYLTYENVQQFLKEGHELDEDLWKTTPSDDDLLEHMKDYMEFALDKAWSHRGLSAGRSVQKMTSYLWLLDNPEVYKEFTEAEYAQYGAPKLMVICKAYSIDVPEHMTEAISNMAQGKKCFDWCTDGCGM